MIIAPIFCCRIFIYCGCNTKSQKVLHGPQYFSLTHKKNLYFFVLLSFYPLTFYFLFFILYKVSFYSQPNSCNSQISILFLSEQYPKSFVTCILIYFMLYQFVLKYYPTSLKKISISRILIYNVLKISIIFYFLQLIILREFSKPRLIMIYFIYYIKIQFFFYI